MSDQVIDVLLVDDNEDMLELASRALERSSVSNLTAKNFEELDKHLTATRPRLILMDVQMPELFGDDVAAALRHVRGIEAKILLYSSLDPTELAALSGKAGLDGWISKSEGITHLIAEVRRLLG